MSDFIKPGIYEDLVTEGLRVEIEKIGGELFADVKPVSSEDLARILSRYAAKAIVAAVESIKDDDRQTLGRDLINRLVDEIATLTGSPTDDERLIDDGPSMLSEVARRLPDGSFERMRRPLLALSENSFLTNSPGEPNLIAQIKSEIESSTSIDVLMAFVFWQGIFPLMDLLKKHIANGGRVRLITTTYRNCTEQRALDELVKIGAEVKVSYDTSNTRLHAKAWLFNRDHGLSTAYIGSSNLSTQAMVTGVEWNVRIAEPSNPEIIQRFKAVFDSYWQTPDYKEYDPEEFRTAVERSQDASRALDFSLLELTPKPFQSRLLELVQASREAGFHRNLVVAATGTGKTMMSAFDYESLSQIMRPGRLLFIAHRREILEQSRKAFALVMRDPSFGELWVDGIKPAKFDHVFASVQTLTNQDLEKVDPERFDVIIVDEAHHIAADSYQKILRHFKPKELLGLTATPERGDGQDILRFFDDRIAAELRVLEAIDQQYLCPFEFFMISDNVDLSGVKWRRGSGYDIEDLTEAYTSSKQWISLVVEQVRQKVLDPSQMHALGFCVSIKHATFVAECFNKTGIKSVVLTGGDESPERQAAIRQLGDGEIQAIFTVDIFNEGIDIPAVDTLLLLRPTDSGLLFMQQIGRGLRRYPEKRVCTILDFVGRHRPEFRYENRFRALMGGGTRTQLKKQIEERFPMLPPGCYIELDEISQQEVLRSLNSAVPSTWPKLVEEFRSLGDVSLAQLLQETGLSLDDIYSKGRSYSELRFLTGLDSIEPSDQTKKLLRGVGRLCHIDDSIRIKKYREWLENSTHPDIASLSVYDRRLARMLSASVTSQLRLNNPSRELELIWNDAAVVRELNGMLEVRQGTVDIVHPAHVSQSNVPLRIHARYSKIELQAALDDTKDGKIVDFWEGARFVTGLKTDIFLFSINKSSSGFSATTRYRDYAISPEVMHWESQSNTSSTSPIARRYINHLQEGTTILLFGRESPAESSYWFLGPATYISHTGSHPVAFKWKLDYRLPAALFPLFAAAA